jgi:hypothetical protein
MTNKETHTAVGSIDGCCVGRSVGMIVGFSKEYQIKLHNYNDWENSK